MTYIISGNVVTKGFVGTGTVANNCSSARSDFWSFTPGATAGSGTWLQVASMPSARYAAFGIALGDKGLVGCGVNNCVFGKSVYIYDPVLNNWTQIADYPLNAAVVKGFSINLNLLNNLAI